MIWCVEDDKSILDIELYALNAAGFETRGFENGQDFWRAIQEEVPTMVILDVMLPGIDGIELLKRIRESARFQKIPVIMATAKGQEYDKIKGLDLGADDYIVKPFSVMEMVSRVKAVLRRVQPEVPQEIIEFEGIKVHLAERIVLIDGQRVSLTYKEFELLCLFLEAPGKVFSREMLFEHVWQSDFIGESRTLDSHIRSLRQKISPYGKKLETIRNIGYRWEANYDK